MNHPVIDVNADLGEYPEALANGNDFELMRHISSANIACGGHAGDVNTMTQTLANAKQLNVAVGAHPGFPDRANFGRVECALSLSEVEASVRQQINSLADVASRMGMRLAHVKPHGALYRAANRDREVALALGRAVRAVDPRLIIVGQGGSPCLEVWRDLGFRCAAEAFADRAYERDGSLRKRTLPGSLLENPELAAEQAFNIVLRHAVVLGNGSELPVQAETICIHSDTPGAPVIARAIQERLRSAGVRIQSLQR